MQAAYQHEAPATYQHAVGTVAHPHLPRAKRGADIHRLPPVWQLVRVHHLGGIRINERHGAAAAIGDRKEAAVAGGGAGERHFALRRRAAEAAVAAASVTAVPVGGAGGGGGGRQQRRRRGNGRDG